MSVSVSNRSRKTETRSVRILLDSAAVEALWKAVAPSTDVIAKNTNKARSVGARKAPCKLALQAQDPFRNGCALTAPLVRRRQSESKLCLRTKKACFARQARQTFKENERKRWRCVTHGQASFFLTPKVRTKTKGCSFAPNFRAGRLLA